MNQQQRKYLIDKIKSTIDKKIEILSKDRMEYPSMSNFLFHAILKNELKLKTEEHILEAIKSKALNAKEGSNWLSNERMGFDKETTIKLHIEDLLEIPKNYDEKLSEIKNHNSKIQTEINLLKTQFDTIETRIQLASDKTLQKLINEVDDMGDLSLIDTKIKLIN